MVVAARSKFTCCVIQTGFDKFMCLLRAYHKNAVMHRIILNCRAHSPPVIAHAHKLGVRSFETLFLPQLGKAFPAQSTVFLKTTSVDTSEIEFQARSLRAALHKDSKLVLMLLDPEFQTVDVEDRLKKFFTLSQSLCTGEVLDSFGLSSNGLCNHRLSLATVKKCLHNAEFSGFKHLQFPFNIMEKQGALDLFPQIPADWEVSTSRPLTAFDTATINGKEASYRLAEAEFPLEYQSSLEQLVQHLTPPEDSPIELKEAAAWLKNLFVQLDEQLSRFTSILHWDRELQEVVLPLINEKFDELDEETVRYMTLFFTQFAQAVRESGGALSRERLAAELPSTGQPLQEVAFKYVLQHNHNAKIAIHASMVQQVADWSKWI